MTVSTIDDIRGAVRVLLTERGDDGAAVAAVVPRARLRTVAAAVNDCDGWAASIRAHQNDGHSVHCMDELGRPEFADPDDCIAKAKGEIDAWASELAAEQAGGHALAVIAGVAREMDRRMSLVRDWPQPTPRPKPEPSKPGAVS
jgi:hypothetical protein